MPHRACCHFTKCVGDATPALRNPSRLAIDSGVMSAHRHKGLIVASGNQPTIRPPPVSRHGSIAGAWRTRRGRADSPRGDGGPSHQIDVDDTLRASVGRLAHAAFSVPRMARSRRRSGCVRAGRSTKFEILRSATPLADGVHRWWHPHSASSGRRGSSNGRESVVPSRAGSWPRARSFCRKKRVLPMAVRRVPCDDRSIPAGRNGGRDRARPVCGRRAVARLLVFYFQWSDKGLEKR